MKKSEKLALLGEATGSYTLLKCDFRYNSYPVYYYIQAVSDRFLYAAAEDDFILDGFCVEKLSALRSVRPVDNLIVQINRERELLKQLHAPTLVLDSWQTVLRSLAALDCFVILEQLEPAEEEAFWLGKIQSVGASSVRFLAFDGDGVWQSVEDIPFRRISRITFGSRYATVWQDYLEVKTAQG